MLRVKCQYLAIAPLGLLELSGLMAFESARQCRTHAYEQSGFCGRYVSIHGAKRDSYWFACALCFPGAAEATILILKILMKTITLRVFLANKSEYNITGHVD